MNRITLATALTMVCAPEQFLATYFAVRDGAVKSLDWLRRDGGKVILTRRGCTVRLTTYSY